MAANSPLMAQLRELLALEQAQSQTLEARRDGARDDDSRAGYDALLTQARKHAQDLGQAIARLGGHPDERKSTFAGIGANLRAVADTFRGGHSKNLEDTRDDFITAQAEVAGSMILENMARALGHDDLASRAEAHRLEHQAMAAWLWNRLQHFARVAVA